MKTEMPAWHHIGRPVLSSPSELRKSGKCLRKTHSCQQIGHLMIQVSHRENPQHIPSNRPCHCANCSYLRSQGCQHPETCYCAAENLLTSLSTRFDLYEDPDPTPNLTRSDRDMIQQHTIGNTNEILTFGHLRQADHNIRNQLRIFTPPWTLPTPLDTADPGPTGNGVVFTDGSCLNNGEAKARASSGIWFGHSNPQNSSILVHENLSENTLFRPIPTHSDHPRMPPDRPSAVSVKSLYPGNGRTMPTTKCRRQTSRFLNVRFGGGVGKHRAEQS